MTAIMQLSRRLRGFVDANTRSAPEGWVEPGRYRVLKRQADVAGDADYTLLAAPEFPDHSTWICDRWSTQRYATIVDAPPPPSAIDFSDDDFAVEASALIALTNVFADYTYDLDEAYYPWPIPGTRVRLAAPAGEHAKQNNCCTFVEALLVKAWTDAYPERFRWDARRHAQMMILSVADRFSPVTAAVEAGIAIEVADEHAPPHPWTLIQGWRRGFQSGHTFIVVDHHRPTDRVLTLESNHAYGLNGVGYRKLGNVRDVGPLPLERWWDNDALWTWAQMCERYRQRAQAVLRVTM